MNISMQTAKSSKKKASAKAPKPNVNLEVVNEMCDEAMATIMALRALVATLAAQQEGRNDH